jgi:hypothetical protein
MMTRLFAFLLFRHSRLAMDSLPRDDLAQGC